MPKAEVVLSSEELELVCLLRRIGELDVELADRVQHAILTILEGIVSNSEG